MQSHDWFEPTYGVNRKCLTLLYFSLSTLEEVEGVRSFGVDVLHNRENIQDVFLCEGRLVAAVKVILFHQDLEGRRTGDKMKAYPRKGRLTSNSAGPTWIPVLTEISLSSVIFCKPYFSTTWSTLSLQKRILHMSQRTQARVDRVLKEDRWRSHH